MLLEMTKELEMKLEARQSKAQAQISNHEPALQLFVLKNKN